MDFDLEKTTAVIERRFGKVPAEALFGVIVLAIIGECFHLIWLYILSPAISGIAVVWHWGTLFFSGAPHAAKVATPTLIGVLKFSAWTIGAALAFLLVILLGSAVRLALRDRRLADAIEASRNEPWSDVRSREALVKNWLRGPVDVRGPD